MTNEKIITTSSPPDQPMIALYYWYIDIPTESLNDQVTFHESLCKDLNLYGRIRISTEGLNGVLSGPATQLKTYEEKIHKKIEQEFRHVVDEDVDERHFVVDGDDNDTLEYGQTLDVKYCHLRKDIPFEKQLFDSLSVKITKEVVSLNEGPIADGNNNNNTDIRKDPTKIKDSQNSNQPKKKKRSRKKNKGDRYEQIMEEDRRKKEQQRKEEDEEKQRQLKLQEQTLQDSSNQSTTTTTTSSSQLEKEALSKIDQYQPATHLSPKEWNEHLLNEQRQHQNNVNDTNITSSNNAILIDARNVYESKIGYFTSKNVPTLLTNTRKYSTITSVFNESIEHLAGKNVYMYCTGGVRCERASVYLQALANSDAWPKDLERPKSIYQLEGGIQKYLEQYGHLEKTEDDMNHHGEKASSMHDEECITKEMNKLDVSFETSIEDKNDKSEMNDKCLFRGKNFVFDPRRYDPMVGNDETPVGQCVVCSNPFDDYDNNHAPCENMEARCCRCRVLILVCNECRLKVRVWGQDKDDESGGQGCRPDVFCGPDGKHCIDEGNSVGHCVIVNRR